MSHHQQHLHGDGKTLEFAEWLRPFQSTAQQVWGRNLRQSGSPQSAEWLDAGLAEELLRVPPEGNIAPEQAADFVRKVVEGFDLIAPRIDEDAKLRGEGLLEAHQRVRRATRLRGVSYRVVPQLPADVLGVYIYLPVG